MSGGSKVHVTISGLTGSGKSAVYMEIYVALKAIGVAVEHADHREFEAMLNGGDADSEAGLQLYRPTVVLEERNIPHTPEARP